MKIALAIENFSVRGGGAESYAVHLARTLVAQGWEVHLFGHAWDRDPEQAVFHHIPPLPRIVPPSAKILHFAFRHRKLVREQDFDVILGFGNTLEMNVYQSHGGVHYRSNIRKLRAVRNPIVRGLKTAVMFMTPKYYARAWIEAAPFRRSPRPEIVAISDLVRNDMAEHFGVPVEEIRLVYNGIDNTRFREVSPGAAIELRRRLGFDSEVLFLFMAYDFRKKGVRYLIKAASRLRDRVGFGRFGVIVVGGTPARSLRNMVSRLGLKRSIVFPGATSEPHMFHAAADAFVLPTFYDACSLVVFEAMAAGLPVITTVHNGAAGIIDNGVDGVVLDNPGDVDALADAMERFLDSSFLLSASTRAQEKAAHYTLEENHRRMLEIFEETARATDRPETG